MLIRVMLFDFGGVLAEEGFRDGLMRIARKNGQDPDSFFEKADRLIGEIGYLTGEATESEYWQALKRETGISDRDHDLRREILDRFIVRDSLVRCVDLIREKGIRVFILSDQTNWLDEIAGGTRFFSHFDGVYNSFRTHKSKRDSRTFTAVCNAVGVRPAEALFIDDNAGHIKRAAEAGLRTILYTSLTDFSAQMRQLTGIACEGSP